MLSAEAIALAESLHPDARAALRECDGPFWRCLPNGTPRVTWVSPNDKARDVTCVPVSALDIVAVTAARLGFPDFGITNGWDAWAEVDTEREFRRVADYASTPHEAALRLLAAAWGAK